MLLGVLVALAVLLVPSRTPRLWARAAPRAAAPVDRHSGRRAAAQTTGEVEGLLAFLDVVAPSLRAGRTPEEAVRLACDVVGGSTFVDAVGEAVAHGRSVDVVVERHARNHPESALFARAWQLSLRTGCPLADAVECAARGVRARLAHRRRVVTASAGARSTIRILMALPLGGPLLAVAVGVDPVEAYLTSPTAWACLAAGGVLVLLGRAWVDRSVRDVARGPVLA
ncbi:type II secretion system F family protein [Mobilicoccus caccae]|nr:type II secretion system F family protein [Mobilicoccus caccae]